MNEAPLGERALRDCPVAVLDLELTGLSPTNDRVCEVAVVRAEGGRVVERYAALVRPPVRMQPGAAAVHGLWEADLADKPPFSAIARRVRDLLHGAVLVAHNAPFDLSFLHREMDACGVAFEPPIYLDTLEMARRLFAFPKNSLGEVASRLGVPHHDAHRALGDAEATYQVFRRFAELLDPDGQVTVDDTLELIDALAPNSPMRLRQRHVLQEAFRLRRTIHIDYQGTSDPLEGLIRREVAVWMLKLPRFQGWCYLREGERVFRLDRVRRLRMGERSYEVPNFERRL